MPLAHHAARTTDRPNEETLRARAACDHLWLGVYYRAYRDVMWGAQTDAPYVFIRLLFPFDDDHRWWCEHIAALWKKHGYALRPGGPAGHGQDIIRLDKEN